MIRFLDLCTSDYFQGSRNEVLEEAKKELKALKKVIDKIIN